MRYIVYIVTLNVAFYLYGMDPAIDISSGQIEPKWEWSLEHPEKPAFKIRLEGLAEDILAPLHAGESLNQAIISFKATMDNSAMSKKPLIIQGAQALIHLILRIYNNPEYRREALRTLLDNAYTNPNLVDSLGYTPFELSVESNDQELVDLITGHSQYRPGSADTMENAPIENQGPVPVPHTINTNNQDHQARAQNDLPITPTIPIVPEQRENQEHQPIQKPIISNIWEKPYLPIIAAGALTICILYIIAQLWDDKKSNTDPLDTDIHNDNQDRAGTPVV